MVHPAFRERGSAIAKPQQIKPSRPPPRIVEGRVSKLHFFVYFDDSLQRKFYAERSQIYKRCQIRWNARKLKLF